MKKTGNKMTSIYPILTLIELCVNRLTSEKCKLKPQ